MEEKKDKHTLFIEDRKKMTIMQVKEVESFNEENINISTSFGGILVKGSTLNIEKLDLLDGKIIITGVINQIAYVDKKDKKDKNLLSKILK